MGGMGQGMPGMRQGMGMGAPPSQPLRRAEPVEYNFNVTLEDLYHGGASSCWGVFDWVE